MKKIFITYLIMLTCISTNFFVMGSKYSFLKTLDKKNFSNCKYLHKKNFSINYDVSDELLCLEKRLQVMEQEINNGKFYNIQEISNELDSIQQEIDTIKKELMEKKIKKNNSYQ